MYVIANGCLDDFTIPWTTIMVAMNTGIHRLLGFASVGWSLVASQLVWNNKWPVQQLHKDRHIANLTRDRANIYYW